MAHKCKLDAAAYQRRYRARRRAAMSPSELKEFLAKMAQKHKAHYAAHRVELSASVREWNKKHPERVKAIREKGQERKLSKRLEDRYGLTLDQYAAIEEYQDWQCKICQREGEWHGKLVVDHDHATGKMRGLLCGACNAGLGCFSDDISLVLKAAQYLGMSA